MRDHKMPSGDKKVWMDDETGEDYFSNLFLQIPILDSHHSHETLGLLEAVPAIRIE